MNFLRKWFGKTPKVMDTPNFWQWFDQNRRSFFDVVNTRNSQKIDVNFLSQVLPRLQAINSEFFCLTGMYDDHTAELIISADGSVKQFGVVEQFVASAPA